MKIAIDTITDGANYGNRLQNYALQSVLEDIGFEVETLRRRTSRDLSAFGIIKDYIKEYIKILIGNKNTHFNRRARYNIFKDFNKEYIRFSDYCLHDNKSPKNISQKYDYFICGSDQLWNVRFSIIQEDIKNYLACFAESSQRISYAASFGTDSISYEYEKLFSKELKKFKALGVREDAGANIIRRLCDRQDVAVVLDPTLLIKKEKWNNFSKKPRYDTNGKYIVTYFLSRKDNIISEYIRSVADELNCRVINLEIEFLNDSEIKDKNVFCTRPDEFVWLISNAECVLTDSFHATVFSILYNKPFVVFQRKAQEKNNDMGSRIYTLLEKFELLTCIDDFDNPTKRPCKFDEDRINEILNLEREKSLKFLESALE